MDWLTRMSSLTSYLRVTTWSIRRLKFDSLAENLKHISSPDMWFTLNFYQPSQPFSMCAGEPKSQLETTPSVNAVGVGGGALNKWSIVANPPSRLG